MKTVNVTFWTLDDNEPTFWTLCLIEQIGDYQQIDKVEVSGRATSW